MSYLSDEQYDFIQDSKEKKTVARSANHKRTHCGKGGRVRLPSDNLSRKELKNMNSEVHSYKLNEPMTWKEFLCMPDDLKVQYVRGLRDKFSVTDKSMACMFGVQRGCVWKEFKRLGLCAGKAAGGKKRRCDQTEFRRWAGLPETDICEEKVEEMTNVCSEEEVEEIDAPKTDLLEPMPLTHPISDELDRLRGSNRNRFYADLDKPKEFSVPRDGNMNFKGYAEDILNSISNLLQNKKVNLNVSWYVIDTED